MTASAMRATMSIAESKCGRKFGGVSPLSSASLLLNLVNSSHTGFTQKSTATYGRFAFTASRTEYSALEKKVFPVLFGPASTVSGATRTVASANLPRF